MKFLCVPCDQPMKLIETTPPDKGSVSLVYSCPACAYEFAMLTNPFETQLVGSLGVKVGPDGGEAAAASGESKCPFSAMVQGSATTATAAEPTAELPWTAEAQQRLDSIPEFVRPMARTGIERFARDRGYARIDDKVLDEARDFFGM